MIYFLQMDTDRRCVSLKNSPKAPYFYGMIAGFGAISLSVIFFFVLYRMQGIREVIDEIMGILAPFVYGGAIAYLLQPVCNWYADLLNSFLPKKLKKLSNGAAVILSMLTGLLLVYALIIKVVPQVVESARTIWNTLPQEIDQLLAWLTAKYGENEALIEYFDTGRDLYGMIDTWVKGTLVPYATSLVSGVGQSVWSMLMFLKNFLIGIIVAIYLLASRHKFKKQGIMIVRSILKPKWADMVLDEIAFVDKMFGGFIDGKIVDSAIIGVLCYIGCLIFRFPNAMLVSVIVGVTNVIPFFGPFIGAVPATLLILIDSPIKALWFVLFVFLLQQLDGNVIGPKILGDHTGLSSFWVLFSIILFGGLWGVVGMIIGVPLFAVIYDLIKKSVHRGLKKNNQQEILEDYNQEYGDPPKEPESPEAGEEKKE